MRIALISDIHGNLHAFEAVLRHARALGADRLVILGDVVVGAPDSARCWALALSLGCPIVRGNHERYVADFGSDRAPAEWDTAQFGPVRWAVEQLSGQAIEEIRALPTSLRMADLPQALFVHGSARRDNDSIYPHTPDAELAAMFPDAESPKLLVRAHNHIAMYRPWGLRTIITNPSAGLPLDGHPLAQYATLDRSPKGEWRCTFHAVAYDLDAAARRFYETNYLRDAGPMAGLFLREVLTASPHFVPFLRALGRFRREQPDVSLDAAVERFLASP